MENKIRAILGVTGSIAAYKAAELVRLMKRREWDVAVVMTEAATRFVSELTFRTLSQAPVAVRMFDDIAEWRPEHVSIADKCDVLVIAPCTANVMAKVAHGIADDLLCCTVLACNAPVVIAPAMNEKMWNNPATQSNLAVLKSRGIQVVNVGKGDLACGYQGYGRMAEPEEIMSVIESCVKGKGRNE